MGKFNNISPSKKLGYGVMIFSLTALLFYSCKKKDEVTNPYADLPQVIQNDNPGADNLPEGSFAWLHAKVFKPTCANSGCHDGTFEPEFRSVNGAYNSLVNQPVISNTPDNTFEVRVKPGNANLSFLHERLTTFVPFSSGIMPLVTEPSSDWPANSAMYIQKISDWINDGAKDMYGNPPPPADSNAPPLVYGLVVLPHNNTASAYPRESDPIYGIGAIEVPSDLVDVWILPYDDNAGVNQFQGISLMAATSSLNFTGALQSVFSLAGPITAIPFDNGNEAQFYYKATLDLSAATPGTYYYLRTYLNDGQQSTITEIPNDESNPFWFLVFSLKIV
jgi:hypothetical protein